MTTYQIQVSSIDVVRGEFDVIEGSARPRRIESGAAMVARTLDSPVVFEPIGPTSLALSGLVRAT